MEFARFHIAAALLVAAGIVVVASPLASASLPFLVVSHPYGVDGIASREYEVLLWSDGDVGAPSINSTGYRFKMETCEEGTIVFVCGGRVGLIAQKSGRLGVFRLGSM